MRYSAEAVHERTQHNHEIETGEIAEAVPYQISRAGVFSQSLRNRRKTWEA